MHIARRNGKSSVVQWFNLSLKILHIHVSLVLLFRDFVLFCISRWLSNTELKKKKNKKEEMTIKMWRKGIEGGQKLGCEIKLGNEGHYFWPITNCPLSLSSSTTTTWCNTTVILQYLMFLLGTYARKVCALLYW